MAINYTWKITGVKKAPSLDGLSNVITHVNFDYTGSKGSGANKKESTFHGACPVGAPDSENFIDIDNYVFEIFNLFVFFNKRLNRISIFFIS